MSKFEKVLTNIEILRHIFEQLGYQQQLKFATVSRHLHYFFRHYIRKEEYRSINIRKHSEYVTVQVETGQGEIDLSYAGLQYFLQVYSDVIEDMCELRGYPLNVDMLRNLKSIAYNQMIVTNESLHMLAQHCPKLEKLSINCCCNRNYDIIRLGEDLKISSLLSLRALKYFSLKTATEFKGKGNSLQELVTQLKLQYYNLKSLIIPEIEDTSCDSAEKKNLNASRSNLEELDIYGTFQSSYTPWNLRTYLPNFENLLILTLIIEDMANDEVMTSLATSCRKLEKLHFRYTTFKHIQSFAMLEKLQELSFHWCKGLTYDNLKEILSEMRLEKFSSTYTKYSGLFQYYFVSPTLKSINIDAFNSFEYRSS